MVQLDYGGDSIIVGYITSGSKAYADAYKCNLKNTQKARNDARRERKNEGR